MNTYSSGHSRRDAGRKARRYKENQAYSVREKLRWGCEATGEMLPTEELDWHHLRDKRFAVAHALRGGHERFLTELAKCICVNRKVHMLIHLQQKINCPEIIWRQVFQNLNTVSPTGSSESMQTCLPPGNFMNPMPRSTADTCQLPVPARPIFVFSWVGGHRYWIMLCTNDIQILSREATNTPDIPGLFIAEAALKVTRGRSPDTLNAYRVAGEPTVIDGLRYFGIESDRNVVQPTISPVSQA